MEKKITIKPYPDENATFTGLYVPEPCACCGSEGTPDMFVVHTKGQRTVLCGRCLEEFRYQAGFALHKDIRINETVYGLMKCDDRQWHIFPMTVRTVRPHGDVRYVKGRGAMVWNIYAESGIASMYKNFYELGESWFYTEEEAKAALKEKMKVQTDDWPGNRPFDPNAIKSGGE